MSKTIALCLTGLVGLLLLSSLCDTSAAALNREALASYRGGVDKVCATEILGPGPHCNTCVTLPDGGLRKCSPTTQDKTWFYNIGQSPSQVWDESYVDCGGVLEAYTIAGCPGAGPVIGNCARQVRKMTWQYNTYAIPCN